MQRTTYLALSVLLTSSVVIAQDRSGGRGSTSAGRPAALTLASAQQAGWTRIKGFVNNTLRDMPETAVPFKPGYNQRSFGEIWGHLADDRFRNCAAARGVANPNTVNLQQSVKTKADVVKAISDSEAFCDPAFASLTDASFVEVVTPITPLEGADGSAARPRGSILEALIEHDSIQYGYAVVYLRTLVQPPPANGRGN